MHDAKSVANLTTLNAAFEEASGALKGGGFSRLTPVQRARTLLDISRTLRKISENYRKNAAHTRSRAREIRRKSPPRGSSIGIGVE